MVKVIGDGLPVVVCPLAYRRMVHFAAYHVPEEPPGWSFVQIVTKDQPGAHSHAPAGGQAGRRAGGIRYLFWEHWSKGFHGGV